jgi:hypothetical protein
LIVDGFLSDVRAKLAEQGILDTRAIVVTPDLNWVPKAEKEDGMSSEASGPATTTSAAPQESTKPAPANKIVVIDLDDD